MPKYTIYKIFAEYLKRVEDENAPHDRVVWNIGRVQNNGARSRSDDVTANRVRFEIVAQVNMTASTGHTIWIKCRERFTRWLLGASGREQAQECKQVRH